MNMAKKLSGVQLKSDDHHNKTSNIMNQLAYDDMFTDVTLVSEDGQALQAHKAILGYSSPYLYSLLKISGKTVNLPLRHSFTKAMLEYIYLGETRVQLMEMKEFLDTANTFKICGLWLEENAEDSKQSLEEQQKHIEIKYDEDENTKVSMRKWETIENMAIVTNAISYEPKEVGSNHEKDMVMARTEDMNVPNTNPPVHTRVISSCDRCDYTTIKKENLQKHVTN
jgi:hypothetical protein